MNTKSFVGCPLRALLTPSLAIVLVSLVNSIIDSAYATLLGFYEQLFSDRAQLLSAAFCRKHLILSQPS